MTGHHSLLTANVPSCTNFTTQEIELITLYYQEVTTPGTSKIWYLITFQQSVIKPSISLTHAKFWLHKYVMQSAAENCVSFWDGEGERAIHTAIFTAAFPQFEILVMAII